MSEQGHPLYTEAALGVVTQQARKRARAEQHLRRSEAELADAIRYAYEIPGVSLARVAAAAGVSKARVHQIVRA